MTSSHVLRPINNEHMTIWLQDNIVFTQVRVDNARFYVSFLHIPQNLPQNLPRIWKLPPLSQFRTLNHPHSYSMTILAQRLWHSNTLRVNKLQRMKLSLSCEPRLEKPARMLRRVTALASGLPKTYSAKPLKLHSYTRARWR